MLSNIYVVEHVGEHAVEHTNRPPSHRADNTARVRGNGRLRHQLFAKNAHEHAAKHEHVLGYSGTPENTQHAILYYVITVILLTV